MSLIIATPRVLQPQTSAVVHPGLLAEELWLPGVSLVGMRRGYALVDGGGTSIVPHRSRLGLARKGGTTPTLVATIPKIDSYPFVLGCVAQHFQSTLSGNAVALGGADNTIFSSVMEAGTVSANRLRAQVRIQNAGGATAIPGTQTQASTHPWCGVAVVRSATETVFFAKGVKETSTTDLGTWDSDGYTNLAICAMSRAGVIGQTYDGYVYLAFYGRIDQGDDFYLRWTKEPDAAYALSFAPHLSRVWLPAAAGGSAAELSGSATSTTTGTASLTTQIQLTGAAASVATASGSLTSEISLSGAAASVSVASGVLTTQIRLSGDALAQVLASGALTTQISLSGAAVMQALASADLTTTPAGLSGNASATATATGQLSTGILLLGEASCIAIAAGGLTTAIQMTGAAVSVSTATGDLTVTSGFSASALAEVTATGTLSTQIQLDAAAVMQAIAAASLTTGAQTVAFYDELDAFYGDFAVQCSANGVPFNGIMDTTDADQFGTLSMSTHRLRYPAVGSAVTAQGDVMVSGVRYKVIEIPRRISRSEMVAELVRQP